MLDRQKEQRRKKALTILGNWAATLIKAICGALFLGVGVYLATGENANFWRLLLIVAAFNLLVYCFRKIFSQEMKQRIAFRMYLRQTKRKHAKEMKEQNEAEKRNFEPKL
jgi:hypothetical protein